MSSLKKNEAEKQEREEEIRSTIEKANTLLVELSQNIGDENAVYQTFLQIYNHIEKIRDLQTLRKKESNPVNDSIVQRQLFEKLQKWLSSNSVDLSQLEINPTHNEGGGVFVKKDFKIGDILISVPRKLALTTELVPNHPVIGTIMEDSIVKNIQSLQLAMLLIYEKFNEKSFWKPYIQSLPKHHTTVYNWNIEEIELLRGTPAFFEAITTICSAFRLYYNCRMLVYTHEFMKLSLFTYDTFVWAMSTVYTRQNKIPNSEALETEEMKSLIEQSENGGDVEGQLYEKLQNIPVNLCLIPGFDMFNHSDQEDITSHYLYNKNSIILTAGKEFKVGEQARMMYGHRSNNELLLFQGFVPKINSKNYITINMTIAQTDKLKEKKVELLQRYEYGFNESLSVRLTLHENVIPSPTMTFIRIAVLNDESALNTQNVEASLKEDRAITFENELKALQILQLRCVDSLKKVQEVPNTQEEIEKISSKTKRLAVEYLNSFKKVLNNNLSMIEERRKKVQKKIDLKQKKKSNKK